MVLYFSAWRKDDRLFVEVQPWAWSLGRNSGVRVVRSVLETIQVVVYVYGDYEVSDASCLSLISSYLRGEVAPRLISLKG